jgi:hypothetical protein
MIDPFGNPYKPIMEKLENTFQGNLTTIIRKGVTYYHLNFNTKISLDLINDYFSKYSLFSSKYLDYLC